MAKTLQFFKNFDSAPFGIYVVSQSRIVVYANAKALEVMKTFEVEKFVGSNFDKTIRSLRLPDNGDEIITRFTHTFDTGESYSTFDYSYPATDSRNEYFDWQIHSITLDAGETGVICYFHDVSKHVSARKELEESRRQFHDLAEAMPQMVWTAQPSGSIDYTNLTTQNYMGVTADRLLGVGYNDFLHPDDVAGAVAHWNVCTKSGVPYDYRFRVRGRDGAYRWFLSRAVPIQSEESKIVKWFGTCTDIDYEVRAAEQLEKSVQERTKELQNLNEEMQRLTSVISHETQEPIVTMSSYLKLLAVRYKERLGPDADEFITKCLMANRKLERMIEDLWNYASVNRPYIDQSLVALTDCVEKASKELAQPIADTKAQIRCHNLPTIYGNKTLIDTLFKHLLDNSIKFCREQPQIEINAEQTATDWIITVQDNGVGIDPVQKNEVFKLYKRLKNDPEDLSTGMGLAICKKIMEVHHGSITLAKAEKGSKFCLAFPKDGDRANRR